MKQTIAKPFRKALRLKPREVVMLAGVSTKRDEHYSHHEFEGVIKSPVFNLLANELFPNTPIANVKMSFMFEVKAVNLEGDKNESSRD